MMKTSSVFVIVGDYENHRLKQIIRSDIHDTYVGIDRQVNLTIDKIDAIFGKDICLIWERFEYGNNVIL